MTNEEIKAALFSRKPVIVRSNKRDTLRYRCVTAVRYTLDNNGEIAVQAELLDNNSNSVKITKASEVFYDE